MTKQKVKNTKDDKDDKKGHLPKGSLKRVVLKRIIFGMDYIAHIESKEQKPR